MSLECSECERDLRGGHAADCSRNRKGKTMSTKEQMEQVAECVASGHIFSCAGADEQVYYLGPGGVAFPAMLDGLSVYLVDKAGQTLWTVHSQYEPGVANHLLKEKATFAEMIALIGEPREPA